MTRPDPAAGLPVEIFVEKDQVAQRVEEVLKLVRLEHMGPRHPRQLLDAQILLLAQETQPTAKEGSLISRIVLFDPRCFLGYHLTDHPSSLSIARFPWRR